MFYNKKTDTQNFETDNIKLQSVKSNYRKLLNLYTYMTAILMSKFMKIVKIPLSFKLAS